MKYKDYAMRFNAMMRITSDFFGTSPKSRTVGDGVMRARTRLAKKLKANKAIPASEVMTRQRIRAQERKEAKTWRVTPAAAHRASFKARRQAKQAALAAAGSKLPPDPAGAFNAVTDERLTAMAKKLSAMLNAEKV